jgi:excisionase family DNA binding protein
VDEAASRLGLSAKSVRRLLAARKLGCLRLGPRGGLIRIRPEDVAAYLDVAARPATTDEPAAARPARVKLCDPSPVRDFFAEREARRARPRPTTA